jgi:FtsZ-binding cell division protein ZapB
MATTAKTPAKATKRAVEPATEYRMPVEVAEWIKQAESRISYLTTRVAELKEENTSLRRANKVMEARVMGQSQE